jgi:O-methyltransferase domain
MGSRRNSDRHQLTLLIQGFQIARLIKAAADLGLADRIEPEGSVDFADLAATLQVEPMRLLRMLRALAAFGVFMADGSSRFRHSTKSLLLRTDNKKSLHYWARFWAMPSNWSTWAGFDLGLRRGPTASEVVLGASRMAYFNAHPDEAAIFDSAMAHRPEDSHKDVAHLYDFSNATQIIDVGGGNGALLQGILSRYSGPKGVTFDREEVVRAAIELGRLAEFGDRHRFQGGNFLKSVPAGSDVYILSDVLSSFPDEACLKILRTCRAGMKKDQHVLVVERLLDPDPAKGNPSDFLVDIQFMLNYGDAHLRTPAEYQQLLAATGFGPMRLITTTTSVAILECLAE